MRALPAVRICPKPLDSRAMFGGPKFGVIEGVEQLGAELEVAPLADGEILRQREVEVRQARAAHDADAGVAERLGRRAECRRKRVGIEPARHRALRFGQTPDCR